VERKAGDSKSASLDCWLLDRNPLRCASGAHPDHHKSTQLVLRGIIVAAIVDIQAARERRISMRRNGAIKLGALIALLLALAVVFDII
jgi:hypothetical protein